MGYNTNVEAETDSYGGCLMDKKQSIPLTSKLNVQNGSHILYFYGCLDKYIDNAVSFIRMGIILEQHSIFIDNEERFALVLQRLREEVAETELSKFVYFVDHEKFYRTYDDFHFEKILLNLNQIIEPYLQHKRNIRLWGHVDWKEQEDILQKLHDYECKCDLTLSDLGFLTVCAYDGTTVPAYIQIEMMKSHEYLLTDDVLVLSNLYKKKKDHSVMFPALSSQIELESEMDLYKQKLDFVHVVSHEVRNPLTVIKAYSKMVMNNVSEQRDRDRLQVINDYVDLIDNEITHIIYTEQMISTESLWRRKLVVPKTLLEEVVSIMGIKARTQNIQFHSDLRLNGTETIFSNAIGLKLIASNLISNAIKYSFEGEKVAFEAYCAASWLILTIQDFGIGMSDDQVRRLFRKYEKINEEKGGQGIGLFMVKKLVDHFEGEIQVDTELGFGTKVQVSLPLQVKTLTKDVAALG
jgi:two-component sensor histidine kinase